MSIEELARELGRGRVDDIGRATSLAEQLTTELGIATGYRLCLDPASVGIEGGDLSAVAWGFGLEGGVDDVTLMASIYVGLASSDTPEAVCNLFYYIGGSRVAPRGSDFRSFRLGSRPIAWIDDGWVHDEYDEYPRELPVTRFGKDAR